MQLVFLALGLLSTACHSQKLTGNQTKAKKEVCYEEIGCLSLDPPWDSLWGSVPLPPSEVLPKFFHRNKWLRTRTPVASEELQNRLGLIRKGRRCTVILHGFASSASAKWVARLEEALLETEGGEILTVDWSAGAEGPNYFQAVANARTVAPLIAKFLQKAIQLGRCSTLHLIGQSLGAHLASFVAANLTNVAEITGLDPAQPWFENNVHETHLDSSDASFVQIVHTNVQPFWFKLGLGFSRPVGHVDYYINGGLAQPGCAKEEKFISYLSDKLDEVVHWIACSHLKAQEYYTEALMQPLSCKYTGVPWEANSKEPPAMDSLCSVDTCQQLGRFSRLLPARGSFYIFTNNTAPVCFKEFVDKAAHMISTQNQTSAWP